MASKTLGTKRESVETPVAQIPDYRHPLRSVSTDDDADLSWSRQPGGWRGRQ